MKKFPKILIVSDEVYDFLVFDSNKYTRFGTIEGMAERTLTIGSLGKFLIIENVLIFIK